jgi:hypothetical protein
MKKHRNNPQFTLLIGYAIMLYLSPQHQKFDGGTPPGASWHQRNDDVCQPPFVLTYNHSRLVRITSLFGSGETGGWWVSNQLMHYVNFPGHP